MKRFSKMVSVMTEVPFACVSSASSAPANRSEIQGTAASAARPAEARRRSHTHAASAATTAAPVSRNFTITASI